MRPTRAQSANTNAATERHCRRSRTMSGLAARLALGVACVALAATSAAVSSAGRAPGATDWPSTNYDQTANRYSPLTQITAKNVSTLQQVWSFHLKPEGFTGPMK